MRKKIASQMVGLVTVRRKACTIPWAVSSTAPIRDILRFSSRFFTFAHTTKTMTSVLIRSLCSLGILRKLIVSGGRARAGYGNHGFVIFLAALAHPVEALC